MDIFYDNFERRKQRRVDLFALGWLFLPFCLICWDVTFHYAVTSVQAWEGSSSPNGLHNLWILKVLMNLSFVVIAWASVARIIRLLDEDAQFDGWSRFVWMLPAIALTINLALFYILWWATRLTQPDLAPRAIQRNGYLMGEFEVGPYESHYTVWIALAITAAIGGLLYARRLR